MNQLRLIMLGALGLVWLSVLLPVRSVFSQSYYEVEEYSQYIYGDYWAGPVDTGVSSKFPATGLTPTVAGDFEVTYDGSAFWTATLDVLYRDGYAFCAMSNGLLILDVSDPASPEPVSKLYLENYQGIAVAVRGDRAYVACCKAGGTYDGAIHIVNISDIARPQVLGKLDSPRFACARDVKAVNGFVYVSSAACVLAVDVSNAGAPQIVARQDIDMGPYKIAIKGDYLFVSAGRDVKIYDISDRSRFELIAELPTPRWAVSVDILDDILVIADHDPMWPAHFSSIQLADITDPANPVLGASSEHFGSLGELAIDPPYAYIGGGLGVNIYEVFGPDSLVLLSNYPSPWECGGIGVNDNYMYVASYFCYWAFGTFLGPCNRCFCSLGRDSVIYPGDFQVVDISDRTAPCATGKYENPLFAENLAVNGDYAYVFGRDYYNWDTRMGVVNVSAQDSLMELYWTYVGAMPYASYVFDDVLYLDREGIGLEINDLADPAYPKPRSVLPLRPSDMEVRNDIACITVSDSGLLLYDVSNLVNPQLLGFYDTPGSACGVAVDGDLVYVADGPEGILIFNINEAQSPTPIGHIPGSPSRLYVRHGIAYILEEGYLRTLDVSDMLNPVPMGELYLGGNPYFVISWESMQAVIRGYYGVSFVDISNPYNPVPSGGFETPGIVHDVTVDGNYIWLADYYSVIRLRLPISTGVHEPPIAELPGQFMLHNPYPNPFNLGTTMAVDMPRTGKVSLDIYNILGQKVKTVVDGVLPAGCHRFVWDGCDNAGRLSSSGVYFARLRTADDTDSRKMVLIK